MSFALDYENTLERIAEGEYECLIKTIYEMITSGGSFYLNIPLIIRNDVAQSFQNHFIWHSIWKKKQPNPADVSCNGYSSYQIFTLSKAIGLPSGKQYPCIEDWMEDIKGKPIRVSVFYESYKGKERMKIDSIGPSSYPDCHHHFKPEIKSNPVSDFPAFIPLDVQDSDIDLPF